MDDLQLKMNFEERINPFRDALMQGKFTLLIENPPPESESDFNAATEHLLSLEDTISNLPPELNAGLAITDHGNQWRAVEMCEILPETRRNNHLVYLSGRNTDMENTNGLIKMANSLGLSNLVSVSGDATGLSVKECQDIPYTESVACLQKFSNSSSFFWGSVVNPFQYTPYALLAQYFKMIKKLNSGANFLVTQAGWDMLKLQSLMWYLRSRGKFYPVIARLLVLTPDKVEKIVSGQMPGIRISPDFRKHLERELHYSYNQFEAAQYRRIELQVAGCRLMGFSGIQLAGADFPNRAKFLAGRISSALKEFTEFEHWLEEYNTYLASAELAPFSPNFRLYDKGLYRDYPETGTPISRSLPPPDLTITQKAAFHVRKCFLKHSDQRSGDSMLILKKMLSGCTGCENCRLPQCEYICPNRCPKHLSNGPCGDLRANGDCELSKEECIHLQIARIAHWQNDFTHLETTIVPPLHNCHK